jgi:crotonobetainyl-CoA:carnitine CoA-transferase CaiB-like acyl-CoA transferase
MQPDFHAAPKRNKRAVAIDLKTETRLNAPHNSISTTDVLMEEQRQGL